MATQSEIFKWARQLNSRAPVMASRIRHTACRKLADNRTAQAVPFLVSALGNSLELVRVTAEDALKSLNTPEAIDSLLLGYVFTRAESLRRILTALGRAVPEVVELPAPGPLEPGSAAGPAEQAWRFHNSRDSTVLAFVPEGDFLAGTEAFRVHLHPYYLAVTCVTNAQYARFLTESRPAPAKLASWINLPVRQAGMSRQPCLPAGRSTVIRKEDGTYKADPEKAELPVVWVTWQGAAAYCNWAGLRLPTELEWEKGARGVDGRLYPWGDEWAAGRELSATPEQKPEELESVWAYPTARSPYGLYQMIGNVYEWCADWYEQDAYQRYARADLRDPRPAEHKVLRGGPWRFGTPVQLRTEYRKSTVWRAGTALCGFRCAKSL